MFGPGLLLQSVTVRAAFTLTGNGSSVMLMWGRDDVEENEGASGCRELSRQAPVRMKAPARASNVLVRMTRFSFARRWLPELQELPVAVVTAIHVPSKGETCTHDGRRNWCWSVAIGWHACGRSATTKFVVSGAASWCVTLRGVRASNRFRGSLDGFLMQH